MREILFRAKRTDNGEWVEGYYIKATHHWHEYGKHEDWLVVDTIQNGGWCNVRGKYAVDPSTVCQFTGLTDKNGTKIFEGDIISDDFRYFWRDDAEYAIVKFGDGYYDGGIYPYIGWFYQVIGENDIDGNALYKQIANERFEVVGNIFDNKELLQ